MRVWQKTTVISSLFISLLVLGACSFGNEFVNDRAYRDVSELDPENTEPVIEPFTDGYTLSEDDSKRIFEAYEILNTVRKDEGLKELKWDAKLEECALIRAQETAAIFDHKRPDGQGWYTVYPGGLLGENICKGSEHADMVMEEWLKNQPDRENFLNDGFTKVAISFYKDAKGKCFWTCEFGADTYQ